MGTKDTDEFAVELDDDERRVLMDGLAQWSGPARATEELAIALGFFTISNLLHESWRLYRAIEVGDPLSALDWTRALAAVEVAFVSDVFGSGYEWQTTTGLPDVPTLAAIRRLQRKLVKHYAPIGRRPPPRRGPRSADAITFADYYWDSLR